jgi:hypothetical protein
VPATTSERREGSSSFASSDGKLSSGSPRASAATTSTWSRLHTLPTTTQSGPQSRFSAAKPRHHRHAGLRQLRRHRRIQRSVRPAHFVPRLLEQARERAHPRAADADQVDLQSGERMDPMSPAGQASAPDTRPN